MASSTSILAATLATAMAGEVLGRQAGAALGCLLPVKVSLVAVLDVGVSGLGRAALATPPLAA